MNQQSTMKRFTIRAVGRVQGINFRREVQKEALKLELRGYAKNEDDGSVRIEVEGEDSKIKKLIEWCQNAPLPIKIDNLSIQEHRNLKNFTSFDIY